TELIDRQLTRRTAYRRKINEFHPPHATHTHRHFRGSISALQRSAERGRTLRGVVAITGCIGFLLGGYLLLGGLR
ncbi:MAG TPA: hypothetical protein VIJ31_10555, partial [Acidothermaceae bacterium]